MSRRRYKRPVWNMHEYAHYQREDLLFLVRLVIMIQCVIAVFLLAVLTVL